MFPKAIAVLSVSKYLQPNLFRVLLLMAQFYPVFSVLRLRSVVLRLTLLLGINVIPTAGRVSLGPVIRCVRSV